MAMKSFFMFIKNRWFISIIGLLSLVILIWFGGPYLGIADSKPLASEASRLIIITAFILFWGLNNLRMQIMANRASNEIISGVTQSVSDDSSIADESEEEVNILRQRFEDAMSVLNKKKGLGGAAKLYELPWYIIIGPPGSGKTTALINSGLDFPLADRFGKEAISGVGGTRNCDWWLTNDAVLLDTAGRYVTQDSHQEVDSAAWTGFLGLLKKYRKRRPINGVIVAISLSDLLSQSEHERSAHVNAIKKRIQELTTQLGMRFPVYMMFTKCDLVAGFMEYFDDMGYEERGQVWGVTFPAGASDDSNAVNLFEDEFGKLLERLDSRLLYRLQQERDTRRRSLLFGFPQQLASLKDLANRFLIDVFAANRYEDAAILRGVYFTSGTQEGTPIDRVMGALSRNFGLDQKVVQNYGGQGKSYFINRLFKDLIFKESDFAGTNRRYEKQRLWAQRVAYIGALTITILAAFAWATSFTRNQLYINAMDNAIADYAEVIKKPLKYEDDFEEIMPGLQALSKAKDVYSQYQDDVPFLLSMGLYQGDKLGGASNAAYLRELANIFIPRVVWRIEQTLLGSSNDPDLQYEALKLYLMLNKPEKMDYTLLKNWMDIDWQQNYPGKANVYGTLNGYMADVEKYGLKKIDIDERVVAGARRNLSRSPMADLFYGRMKRDYLATDNNSLNIYDLTGSSGDVVFQFDSGEGMRKRIPGIFTYAGFYDVFFKNLNQQVKLIRGEAWVLGTDSDDLNKAELEQLETSIRKLYYAEYIDTWDTLLSDMKIVPFRNVNHATKVMDVMSGPNSPLRQLLSSVERNTNLTRLPGGIGKLAGESAEALKGKSRLARLFGSSTDAIKATAIDLPGTEVEAHYNQLNQVVTGREDVRPGLERIIDMLSELYGYYSALNSGDEPADAKRILNQLNVEGSRQPQPVKKWMQQVVSNTKTIIIRNTRAKLNNIWASDVLSTCKKLVRSHYPFNRSAKKDITLRGFSELFSPGGLIDEYFQSNVKQFVNTSGEKWRWNKAGRSMGLSTGALKNMQNASIIKDMFFQEGGKEPRVNFVIKPVYLDGSVRRFMLEIDGMQYRYEHGPSIPKNATWPGADSPGIIRVSFEDVSGFNSSFSIIGEWAMFRLLDRSQISKSGQDKFNLKINYQNRSAEYEIFTDSVENPFISNALTDFSCAAKL